MPAFLTAALQLSGISSTIDPMSLPRKLGVHVLTGDFNPLNLDVATEDQVPGVTAANTLGRFNSYCSTAGYPVRLRHVPFNTITLGLYEDVLTSALEGSIVVGVGVDFNILRGENVDGNTLHLLRVVGVQEKIVSVFDDSGECAPPALSVDWMTLERAVIGADDGFWLVGSPAKLELPYTPPVKNELSS